MFNNGKEISAKDRSHLLDAMEKNRNGKEVVFCDSCGSLIQLQFDTSNRVIKTMCSCGKFSVTFRPI